MATSRRSNVNNNDLVIYIYTSSWVEWSAGIKVLHLLCHHMNIQGFQAFLVLHGPTSKNGDTNPRLNTPVLNRSLAGEHHKNNLKIVAIYPETILGNPLKAPNVARWILNYPTLLGGEQFFTDEFIFSYTRNLARSLEVRHREVPVVFLPAIDFNEIMHLNRSVHNGPAVYYAQKYRILGGDISIPDDAIEIERFGKSATSRQTTLQLIANASALHAYENTTAISEAMLLGTPVYLHKNKYFDELIAEHELGNVGTTWDLNKKILGDSSEAKKYLDEASRKLPSEINRLGEKLFEFASFSPNFSEVRLPNRRILSLHSIRRFFLVLRQKGPFTTFRFIKNYLNRGQYSIK